MPGFSNPFKVGDKARRRMVTLGANGAVGTVTEIVMLGAHECLMVQFPGGRTETFAWSTYEHPMIGLEPLISSHSRS